VGTVKHYVGLMKKIARMPDIDRKAILKTLKKTREEKKGAKVC
jgi:hypothetical protein